MFLVWSVRFKFSRAPFFWGEETQRIKETNQLVADEKNHSWNQQLLCSEVELKKVSEIAFIIYTKELRRKLKKGKNSCGGKWRPLLGRKIPHGLAVFRAGWLDFGQSLLQPSRPRSQRLQQSMDEKKIRSQEKKLVKRKSRDTMRVFFSLCLSFCLLK